MKMFFRLFVSLSLFINEISSFTVVNNVTLNSDVLKEIFFMEIQNSKEIDQIIEQESGKYNSEKCFLSLREIVSRFPSADVLPFIDAWGHLPSGIAYGNTYDTGEFDQCVKISVSLNELTGVVNGQYCFASLALPNTFSGVKTAICVPDTCSPEYLTSIFKSSSDNFLNGALTDIISIGHCTDGKIPPLSTINIVAISIFSVVTGLMILSSLYEFLMEYYNKTPVPILIAFSILTNGKKLFAISTKRSRNSIDCFNGLRVLSTLWIMHHHVCTNIWMVQTANMTKFLAFSGGSFWFMPFGMATNAVNTFLFIGGLLVAFNGFRDLDKTKGKINVAMNIVHRYIRLTPIVAVGLLLLYGINDILYTGPFKDAAREANTCDGSNWWPVLLYIHNYYIQKKQCYDESWYLAVDFHLYILSPLLLIPMWKWGKKILGIVCFLILASIAYIITIFYVKKFTGFTQGSNDGEWELTYVPTHTRFTPWLMGFVLGYFMHYNRQANFRINKPSSILDYAKASETADAMWKSFTFDQPWLVQLLMWIGSFTMLIAVVFGPYPTIHAYGKGTVFEAAMYAGLKHFAWAVALVWITFACYYGLGGVVDTFLSHPFWQPLSRLTYALYMMHMAVMRMHMGMSRVPMQFSIYNIILFFMSACGITLLISIYVTLAFESPIIILEKFIFGGEKPTKQVISKEEQTVPKTITVASAATV